MKITVVGMGKIGLPLAVQFARKGNHVIGLEISEKVVDKINSGVEPFPGEKDLQIKLLEVLRNNNFYCTNNYENAIRESEVIVVCIPLIIDSKGKPDFENIDNLVTLIGKYVQKNTLISFETTLPVGTTRNRFSKIISRESGYEIGKGINIVFSPERVYTGRIFEDLRRYPKLVGGVTPMCTKKGVSFYEQVIDFDERKDLNKNNGVWALKNSETAEFAKIAETTYRDVNIGLANEFSIFAIENNVDFSQVIEAANSQPYSNIHYPGISVGGHCIPVYPQFYINDNENASITMAARARNLSMPNVAVSRILEKIGNLENLKVGVLGISYRPGVKETAFSGAMDLLRLLKGKGAQVFGFDPFYNENEIHHLGFEFKEDFNDLDILIIHTDHYEFKNFNYYTLSKLKILFDGRNCLADLKDKKSHFVVMNFESG